MVDPAVRLCALPTLCVFLAGCQVSFLHDLGSYSLEVCGDGVVQPGEECDEGPHNSDEISNACRSACKRPWCGDGVVDADEECDDANETNSDGCNDDCTAWLWTINFDQNGEDTYAWDMACDSQGQVVVTGMTHTASTEDDILVLKLDSEGGLVWSITVNGDGDGDDSGNGVAVDSQDNIIVTGVMTRTRGDLDVWTAKYSPQGQIVWTATHDGPGGSDDVGGGVAVDSDDDIVVTGSDGATDGQTRLWVRKYDASGAEVWTRTVQGVESVRSYANNGNSVATDEVGNIFVAGSIGRTLDRLDSWVGTYDESGDLQWSATHSGGGGGHCYDELTDVVPDGQGGVFVIGHECMPDASHADKFSSIWVARYENDGELGWYRSESQQDSEYNLGYGIAVDVNGDVLAIGSMEYGELGGGVWLRKYDSAGEEVWTRTYANRAGDRAVGLSVCTDPDGNIVIAGGERVDGRDYIWIRKYMP
ncbi:DUF4215 domain-containing protein [Myxococcota bacterium]